jgi:acetoin utilization deacetylase AcuC-like enzyme
MAASIEALRTRRVSGSLSSGLHHARRARGAGFCTLRPAPCSSLISTRIVAAARMRSSTATSGFGRDVSVDAFDRNEPLGNNQLEIVHDSSRYLPTIERKLKWLEREAPRFDICLYNAGMDPFGGCSIGGMQGVTQKVLHDREVAVFSWCHMRGVPIAFAVAGGYLGPELDRAGLVALHRLTLEAANGSPAADICEL